MHNSKEELIELMELSSPAKSDQTRIIRRNKIDSSSIDDLSTTSHEGEIINLFSVKKPVGKHSGNIKKNSNVDSQTTSEPSDDVFVSENAEFSSKSGNNKSYKEKISQHFKSIKQKAGNARIMKPIKASKMKYPMERIRKQSRDLNAEIDEAKNKFKRHREDDSPAMQNFLFFSGMDNGKQAVDPEIKKPESELTEKAVGYCLPSQLHFNITLSEKDNYFIPNGRNKVDVFKKIKKEANLEGDGSYVRPQPNILRGDINILEQRLLSDEDEQWFDCAGNLDFLENPVIRKSIRPEGIKHDKKESSYKLATMQEECREIIILQENILLLYLSHLKFTFHPLFSIEHFFVQKLNSLYEEYVYNMEHNNLQKIKDQLEALRCMRNNIEMSETESGDSPTNNILNLNKEIKKIRKIYFEEGKKERENLKFILETWRQIKKIRANQKYSNTNIKLIIKKEKVHFNSEKEQHDKIFEETLEEIVREHKIERQMEDTLVERDDHEGDNPVNLKENTDFDIDENMIRYELKKKFEESFKAPGEPTLLLLLSNNSEITKDIPNNKEIMRRMAILSTQIYLKLFCDNIEVCKTKALFLNEDFSFDLDEPFSLKLIKIPKYLSIEIFEQPKGLIKKKICEININIPSQNISMENSKVHKIRFEKKDMLVVHYKHEGLGSGINLKKAIEKLNITIPIKDNDELITAGFLEYSIGWEKILKTNEDSHTFNLGLLNAVTDKYLTINTDKLSEWLDQNGPDRQDPKDSAFFEYIADCGPNLFKNGREKYFRLSPHIGNFNFCSISAIDQNIRLKILQLRNQNEIEFDGVVIPNRVKELAYFFNILTDLKNRKAAENRGFFEEDHEDDQIEMKRSFSKKYLKQIYEKIFQKCKSSENNLTYESVVNEQYIIYFQLMVKTLLRNFFNWFRWQPKVNKPLPIKAEISNIDSSKDDHKMMEQINIIIKIISGKNVPSRTKYMFNKSYRTGFDSVGDHTENEVRPFVQISYENKSVQTNTSSGINPIWNETLTLPLESHHTDYLNQNSLNGIITVNLYDESEIEIEKLNKRCFNWLGGLEISLSAICYSNSMKGLFKVRPPQLLLGYETEIERHKTKSPKINTSQSYNHHTYLQMEISVQPNIPKLAANMDEFPSGDVPYLQEHIKKWNQAYNNSFPNRKFSALAIDTNAKTICITRYLKPLEPPQINLEEFDVTAEQCLRFISLIPFTECNQFYSNVWLSTNELLRFMVGSIIDHAVTLTCYLLALNIEAWLLLGFGIPHGCTAYVLVREYGTDTEIPSYYVYDVVYNEKYNLTDTYCPLQRIFCIANGKNVWANIQRNDNVNIMRFDLNKKSDWLPLFNNNVNAPIHFINNKVTYKLKNDAEELEIQVEKQIKKKISKLRQLDRTIWNHNLAKTFKKTLRSFEINCMYNKNHFETISELNDKLSSFHITGYAINTLFTGISGITKKIQSLGIVVQEESNTEFALAVYIQTYPGQVLSVWILIGSISQKD